MPKLAANLSMLFTERDFLDRFAAAATFGFRGVEYLFPYEYPAETLAARLREHDLHNALFNLPPGDWAAGERGLAGLPGREAEFREALDLALSYARALGCPRVHAMHGIPPAGAEPAACRETYVENLRHAARTAAESGVTVLIEPLNPRDNPGYPLNRQADAHAVVARVAEPNLMVQFDLYHCQIVEGDLTVKLRQYLAGAGHIQIAGVPDRQEPDTGELDCRYLLALLDELGYSGWVGCEYRPARRTEDGLGWAAPYGIG